MKEKDHLLKHSSVMLIASAIGMFSNYLFHAYMGRALGPVEYGILGSLLSVLYILLIPVGTIQTVIAKFVSVFKTRNELGKINSLLFRSLKKFIPYAIFSFIIISLSSWFIADFLKIPSNVPVVLLGFALIFSILLPEPLGVLQGLQNFNQLALNTTLNVVLKLIFGVILVYVGLGVNGAIFAYGLATAVVFFLCFIPLKFLFGKSDDNITVKEIYVFSLPVILVVASFSVATSVDVIFVKHFLNYVDAGYYTAASMIAKIIFFTSITIASVIFPKASALYAIKGDFAHILKKSLFYMGLLAMSAVLVFYMFPTTIVTIVYGAKYIYIAPLLAPFGIAMSFFSVAYIISYYNLSINNTKYVAIPIICTVLEVILLSLFHSTLVEIIQVLVVVGLVMVILFGIFGLCSKVIKHGSETNAR